MSPSASLPKSCSRCWDLCYLSRLPVEPVLSVQLWSEPSSRLLPSPGFILRSAWECFTSSVSSSHVWLSRRNGARSCKAERHSTKPCATFMHVGVAFWHVALGRSFRSSAVPAKFLSLYMHLALTRQS